jgi:arylsulfatase A-like enzyme
MAAYNETEKQKTIGENTANYDDQIEDTNQQLEEILQELSEN